jgi:hypothetical protein
MRPTLLATERGLASLPDAEPSRQVQKELLEQKNKAALLEAAKTNALFNKVPSQSNGSTQASKTMGTSTKITRELSAAAHAACESPIS